jgi:SNF2 family DNA or RNA helicase
MYLYYTFDINWDTKKYPHGNLVSGKIKNNLSLDKLEFNPNIIEEIHNDNENIYKKFKIMYDTIVDDITFNVNINFLKILKMELFTPSLVINNRYIRDFLHMHYIISNNLIQPYFHSYKMEQFMKEIEKPLILELNNYSTPIIQTELYPYQIDNLKWMEYMENIENKSNIDNTIYINNDRIIKFSNGLEYNSITNSFLNPEEKERMKYIINGGIIANEVGTGKTIIAIMHCIKNSNLNNLILVPNHLKQHWELEFIKHTGQSINNFKNIGLYTFDEFDKCNTESIKYIFGKYNRIFVDELHELYKNEINLINLTKLSELPNIKYRWGITSTPIINKESLYHIICFLLGKSKNQLYNSYIGHYDEIQKEMRKFFRRILKNNINYLLKLPEITINDNIIPFSKLEQEIYDAESINKHNNISNMDFLRKLCCDILFSIEKDNNKGITIEELKTEVLKYFKKKYVIENDKLINYQEQLDNINNEIIHLQNNNENNINIIIQLRYNLNHYQELFKTQEKICISRKTVYERYEQNFNKIEKIINQDNQDNQEDNCAICLNSHSNPVVYLRQCGHYFCKPCFDALEISTKYNYYQELNCPECKTIIKDNDKIIVTNKVKQCIGTKYKEVVKIITNNSTYGSTPFVIYTQYPTILSNLQVHLNKFNITVGYLEDLQNLQNGVYPHVLLMSSNTTSSGLDLTYYSNIIIFEPFVNYIYGREIEKQIIGRLHRINQKNNVNVFRLIIKNTIEEQIYEILNF